jgi:metal-sulfur cluster biosynthetic enzyme
MSDLIDAARDALRRVDDPEAGINIVDLGLVYDIRAENGGVAVLMTFTTEACPVGPSLAAAAEEALQSLPGRPPVTLEITFDPPWTPERITPEGRALLAR